MPCIDERTDVDIRDERVAVKPRSQGPPIFFGGRALAASHYEDVPNAAGAPAAQEPRGLNRFADEGVPESIHPIISEILWKTEARLEPELPKLPEPELLSQPLLHVRTSVFISA